MPRSFSSRRGSLTAEQAEDLQEAMLGLEDSALGQVYSHLLEGSERHLEAFTGQIAAWADPGF